MCRGGGNSFGITIVRPNSVLESPRISEKESKITLGVGLLGAEFFGTVEGRR